AIPVLSETSRYCRRYDDEKMPHATLGWGRLHQNGGEGIGVIQPVLQDNCALLYNRALRHRGNRRAVSMRLFLRRSNTPSSFCPTVVFRAKDLGQSEPRLFVLWRMPCFWGRG